MATKKTTEVIEIRPIEEKTVKLRIVGTTPLIMHKWSEKAKRQMLEKQMGLSKGKKKEPKNPMYDFIKSMYWIDGEPEITEKTSEEECTEKFIQAIQNGARFGFPAGGIKKAGISAAYRNGWSKDKVSLGGVFYIEGDENNLIEIKSDPPIMREDPVKIQTTTDLRYRGEFRNWYADISVRYDVNGAYSLENIVNIINAGGHYTGIGEWRPEKLGDYGQYRVAITE